MSTAVEITMLLALMTHPDTGIPSIRDATPYMRTKTQSADEVCEEAADVLRAKARVFNSDMDRDESRARVWFTCIGLKLDTGKSK